MTPLHHTVTHLDMQVVGWKGRGSMILSNRARELDLSINITLIMAREDEET
jgi:hypothetical protein